MCQKKSRLVKSLEKIDDVVNLEIDTNEVTDGKLKVVGSFDSEDCHYSFFYSESSPLIISEISLSFTYESVHSDSELHVYKSIDEFNKYSFAIKAYILDMNHETKELTIDFSCGSLLDPEFIGDGLIDAHPSIVILNRIPLKLSSILKQNGVTHNFLDELKDESEEE